MSARKVVRVRVLGTKWDCIGGLMGGSVNKFLKTVFTEELAEADAEAEDEEDDDADDEEEDEEDDDCLDNGDLERHRFGFALSLVDLLSALSLSVDIESLLSLLALSSS